MSSSNEDRPDPSEQPIRARVPEHVARGAFSTGVIVMTAQTEFILDFIQNLGRPHQIVARVVMPHSVLPQLVDALYRNMELYRSRWGELPHIPQLPPVQTSVSHHGTGPNHPPSTPNFGQTTEIAMGQLPPAPAQGASAGNAPGSVGPGTGGSVASGNAGSTVPPAVANAPGPNQPPQDPAANANASSHHPTQASHHPTQDSGVRRPSAQEIYDDLKIRDEMLSGAYANAVMIGHGPHEFSFDFITNFFPHSAVSCRVFLAAGQVPRFYDSLKGTWDQLRMRLP